MPQRDMSMRPNSTTNNPGRTYRFLDQALSPSSRLARSPRLLNQPLASSAAHRLRPQLHLLQHRAGPRPQGSACGASSRRSGSSRSRTPASLRATSGWVLRLGRQAGAWPPAAALGLRVRCVRRSRRQPAQCWRSPSSSNGCWWTRPASGSCQPAATRCSARRAARSRRRRPRHCRGRAPNWFSDQCSSGGAQDLPGQNHPALMRCSKSHPASTDDARAAAPLATAGRKNTFTGSPPWRQLKLRERV